VLVLYGIVDFSFYAAFVSSLRKSKASWTSLQEVANSCTAYGALFPSFVAITQSHPHAHGLTLPTLKNVTTIDGVQMLTGAQQRTSWRNTGIIVGIMLAIVVGLILFCYTCSRCDDSNSCSCCEEIGGGIVVFIGSLFIGAAYLTPFAFPFACIYCLVQLERKRNTMKAITGAEFQDNAWGFAQVVAIFLWIPLILLSFHWFFGGGMSGFHSTG
jgi:hypothetical protein